MTVFVVLDKRTLQVFAVLDISIDPCYDGRCGGCNNCLLVQATQAEVLKVVDYADWHNNYRRRESKANWMIEGF